jgi:HAE1 family hydrophobic/amphiphilic exporter-1
VRSATSSETAAAAEAERNSRHAAGPPHDPRPEIDGGGGSGGLNPAEGCIRRPVATTLLMLALVVAGLCGWRGLPVAALPHIDYPKINVVATLPGAAPEAMAAAVATPLERELASVPGIASMTSSNGLGRTSITLEFVLGRDIDGAALDVQQALAAAADTLPREMLTPPTLWKSDPTDQPVLVLALRSATLPITAITEYADRAIARRLSTLPGVAQVQIWGARKAAVRVQVDPDAIAADGLSFSDVQGAVAAAASNRPVGTLDGARQSVTIAASPPPAAADGYRSLIIAAGKGGAGSVRLGEVARVIDGVENERNASWMDGERSLLVAVKRQFDADTVGIADRVKALLPSIRAELPASLRLDVMIDGSESIRASIDEVEFTLALTVALVVLVIFLFLRNLTATIIPALALPVSLIGTFAGMYLCGYSIDNLSLLAITLSVGFVVDDAIVMLENIVRHIETGMKPFQAALQGAREIGFTILSITLSLVAVFIPVLFMGGIVGRLFREFAVTISLTILISGFVSLTLTPMLCSRFLRAHDEHKRPNLLFRLSEAAFDALLRGYDWTLRKVLAFKFLTLLATLATVAISGYLYVTIPKGFFPTEDTGQIFAITQARQDISFQAMAEAQRKVAAVIQADPAVSVVNSTVGATGFSTALNSGRLFIGLKPLEERRIPVQAVIQRLRGKLAGNPDINVFLQPIQNIQVGGRLSKSQYQYTVQADDFGRLREWAPRLEERLKKLPGLQDVTSDLEIRAPQALVELDRDKAASLNVTADAVRTTLYSAFGTRQVAAIYTPTNDYQVILEADPKYQQDIGALSALYVRTTDGQLVPLDTVATVRRMAGPVSVNHQAQLPAVTISFNLTPGVSLGQAVERIQAAEREMNLPATILTNFQGTAQVFQEALRGQGLLLGAAVFVIYVVLGILYESFIHPITILSGLPAAGLGALLTLMLFGMDLSVIAIIGIVMLIGIVKKNAIMMIDFAIERRRTSDATPEQAIYEACLLRFRPIMMTTMAAIMGALPIAMGTGAGAELRQPLGLAVVGGLIVSQLLTLFITPVIYLYLERINTRRGRRRAPVPVPASAVTAVASPLGPGYVPAQGND